MSVIEFPGVVPQPPASFMILVLKIVPKRTPPFPMQWTNIGRKRRAAPARVKVPIEPRAAVEL